MYHIITIVQAVHIVHIHHFIVDHLLLQEGVLHVVQEGHHVVLQEGLHTEPPMLQDLAPVHVPVLLNSQMVFKE